MATLTRMLAVAALAALTVAPGVVASTRMLVVESSRTRVGLARVILEMAPLVLTEDGLTGTYAIRVPLAPSNNDSGTIEIPIATSLSAAIAPGNTVRGFASSREDGRVHDVACTFTDRGRVKIVVTTPDRKLAFEAPYRLDPEGSAAARR